MELREGALFVDMPQLTSGAAHVTHLTVQEASVVYQLPSKALLRFLDNNPGLNLTIMGSLVVE